MHLQRPHRKHIRRWCCLVHAERENGIRCCADDRLCFAATLGSGIQACGFWPHALISPPPWRFMRCMQMAHRVRDLQCTKVGICSSALPRAVLPSPEPTCCD